MSLAISVAEAAGLVASEPAGLLLLDTCALLDVIRVSNLGRKQPHHLMGAAQVIIDSARSKPRRLWLFASEPVYREWDLHAENTSRDATNLIQGLDTSVHGIHSVLRSMQSYKLRTAEPMGANVTLLTEAPNYSSLDIPQHLLNLARRVLDEALALKVTDRIALTARQRSILGKKPADKGKPSRSDCEIIETYIALGRALGKAAEPRLGVNASPVGAARPIAATVRLHTSTPLIAVRYQRTLHYAHSERPASRTVAAH